MQGGVVEHDLCHSLRAKHVRQPLRIDSPMQKPIIVQAQEDRSLGAQPVSLHCLTKSGDLWLSYIRMREIRFDDLQRFAMGIQIAKDRVHVCNEFSNLKVSKKVFRKAFQRLRNKLWSSASNQTNI